VQCVGRFESDFTHTLVLWSSCAESINCPQPPLVSLKINKIHLLEALLHQYSPEGAARPTQRPAQRGRGPRGSAPPAVGPRSGAGAARHAQRGEGGAVAWPWPLPQKHQRLPACCLYFVE